MNSIFLDPNFVGQKIFLTTIFRICMVILWPIASFGHYLCALYGSISVLCLVLFLCFAWFYLYAMYGSIQYLLTLYKPMHLTDRPVVCSGGVYGIGSVLLISLNCLPMGTLVHLRDIRDFLWSSGTLKGQNITRSGPKSFLELIFFGPNTF